MQQYWYAVGISITNYFYPYIYTPLIFLLYALQMQFKRSHCSDGIRITNCDATFLHCNRLDIMNTYGKNFTKEERHSEFSEDTKL